MAEVSGRLLKLIEQSQKDPIRGTALQALIDTRQKPEGEAVGEEPLSNSEIVGNVMTLLAGEDTTANALAWSLLYLATQPEILKKVREEADRVLGPTGVPESLEQANALVYAGHVFKEVLRMRSPAPLMFMEPTRDLEVGGLNLSGTTGSGPKPRKTAMDPQHFTDPERFWPERWASPSPAPQHTPRAMLAFGGGPRTCLGAQLAMIEGQSVLATICRAFDFELRCDPRGDRRSFRLRHVPVSDADTPETAEFITRRRNRSIEQECEPTSNLSDPKPPISSTLRTPNRPPTPDLRSQSPAGIPGPHGARPTDRPGRVEATSRAPHAGKRVG